MKRVLKTGLFFAFALFLFGVGTLFAPPARALDVAIDGTTFPDAAFQFLKGFQAFQRCKKTVHGCRRFLHDSLRIFNFNRSSSPPIAAQNPRPFQYIPRLHLPHDCKHQT